MNARIFVLLFALALLPVADTLAQYPGMGGRGDRGDGDGSGSGGPGRGGYGRGGYGGPGRYGSSYGGPGRGGSSYGRPQMGTPPGGSQPGRPQPGGPQPSGSSSRSEDYARERASRMEGFLRNFDANGDGTIDPSEVTDERQKRMLGYMAQRYGFEVGKPIQLSKLREAMTQPRSSQSRGESDKSKQEEDDQPPLVPGFGVSGSSEDAPAIPRFGQRVGRQLVGSATAASPAAKPAGGSAKPPAEPVNENEKIRKYANLMLQKHDDNKNGRLDRDEWEGVRPDPQRADRDNNGVVTLDELTAALVGYSKDRSPGDDWAAFNPYRAMTRWERLPDELLDKDHFMELDTNGDGQVAMVEFTVAWDDSHAREFGFKDRNGDGLITPQEWIAADAIPEEERLASADAAPPRGHTGLRGGPSPTETVGSAAATSESPAEEKAESKPWWEAE